ncbi:MAG: hypothetical protein ACP5U1_16540, partial [Desulfomonilaceae bacterium]
MKTGYRLPVHIVTIIFLIVTTGKALGQQAAIAPQFTGYKMTTPVPPGIECPDKVETRIGPLRFFDGFPDGASVEKLYDNLDFQRAVQ